MAKAELSELAKQILQHHETNPREICYAQQRIIDKSGVEAMDAAYQELLAADKIELQKDAGRVTVHGQLRNQFKFKRPRSGDDE
jgi:hypothetical protein